jgi:hypothetical protein
MSVVVRIGNGSPILLCKGADSSMFPFCLTGPYTTQVDRLLTLSPLISFVPMCSAKSMSMILRALD